MKFTVFLLSILIAINSSACHASEESLPKDDLKNEKDGVELKVLSYNIHHCNPPSIPGLIDVESIANVIIQSEADIVGLQEVDVFTERSGSDLHMVEKLSELTGLTYFYFSKGIDYQGGEYGTAILSKHPLSDMQTIQLPFEEGTEPRTLSLAMVTLESGQKVQFANTHLDFSSASNGLNQAKSILEYFKDKHGPIILVGDFNAVQTSQTIALLDGEFRRTCKLDCPPTIPVINPTRTIDYIFYRSKDDFQVVNHRVIPERYASDHLPVLATLLWEE